MGVSVGIGLVIVYELVGFGVDLMIVGCDIDMLEMVCDELLDVYLQYQVYVLVVDVFDDEDCWQILDWVEDYSDGLYILVNNVGGNVIKVVMEYFEDEWCKIFEINLFLVFELLCYVYLLLVWYVLLFIVNVGSVFGLIYVCSGVVYGMIKVVMYQMICNLVVEWVEDGIWVNVVVFWYICMWCMFGLLLDLDYYEEVINCMLMCCIGELEEVVVVVGFLCLLVVSYVIGECIVVDGGFLCYGF